MILITGGTGFIGQVLVWHLVEAGYPVRLLLRPSLQSPNLPRGMSVEAAVSSLNDRRGLRAAMVGVDTVYHLAGSEQLGARANLSEVDIQGTEAVTQAATQAGVDRIFTVSHLGADRASAYPVLKAKAIAEQRICRSGIDYTILRSALVFGPNDSLTNGLARLLYALPYFFLLPGDGGTLIQPLWVDDLVTCLVWALDDDQTRNQIYEVGGPEHLTFNQVLRTVMLKLGIDRSIVYLPPPYVRALTVLLESIFPNLPVSVFWLDYLATDRSCALDTIPRAFGLMPSRFSYQLDYLARQNWCRAMWQSLIARNV